MTDGKTSTDSVGVTETPKEYYAVYSIRELKQFIAYIKQNSENTGDHNTIVLRFNENKEFEGQLNETKKFESRMLNLRVKMMKSK